MGLKKVILLDKVIEEEQIVSFIMDCLRETGGIPSVSKRLSELGFKDFSKVAYKILDESKKTGNIDLGGYSSNQLREICNCIVHELEDCQDLDTLMCLNIDSAEKLIGSI